MCSVYLSDQVLSVSLCQLSQQYRRRCFRLQTVRCFRPVQPLAFTRDRSLQMLSSRTLHTAAGESRPADPDPPHDSLCVFQIFGVCLRV